MQDDRPTTAETTASRTTSAPAFVAELTERVARTRVSIDTASAAGDEDLADAHTGELEALLLLAEGHDVALPDTRAYLASRREDVVVDLTGRTVPAA